MYVCIDKVQSEYIVKCMEGKEIFPEFNLFPKLAKVIGGLVFCLVRQLPEKGYPPDHRGAEAILDQQIFDDPTHSKTLPYRHIPRID